MTRKQQITRKLDALAAACKALDMQVVYTRDPGLRICPIGPRWGNGRYIFIAGAYVLRVGVKEATAEVNALSQNAKNCRN